MREAAATSVLGGGEPVGTVRPANIELTIPAE
jgi:hypothetical protein